MWKCKNCNEDVEDNFDNCWNCGSDKSGNTLSEKEQTVFEENKKDDSESEKEKAELKNTQTPDGANKNYKVVPFNPSNNVPSSLQRIINSEAVSGWKYVNHQYSDKLKHGNAGCFGIGATPDSTIHIGFVVFEKK